MQAAAYIGAKVISQLEERLSAVTVSAWFDDAELVELNENNPLSIRPLILGRKSFSAVANSM